ncbi:MAG: hypothetical protein PHE49_04285 [bacterium]|nr:hypothetical protein [bacterium]
MQDNTMPLIFGRPLWNKILFIVFVLLTILEFGIDLQSDLHYGFSFYKISTYLMAVVLLDFFAAIMFSKVIVTKEELIYEPGGFICKWFFRKRLKWQDYKFYLHYWIDVLPSSKHLYSYTTICAVEKKSNKMRFKLKSRYPEYMKGIVEALGDACSESERVRDYTFWDWLDDKFDR